MLFHPLVAHLALSSVILATVVEASPTRHTSDEAKSAHGRQPIQVGPYYYFPPAELHSQPSSASASPRNSKSLRLRHILHIDTEPGSNIFQTLDLDDIHSYNRFVNQQRLAREARVNAAAAAAAGDDDVADPIEPLPEWELSISFQEGGVPEWSKVSQLARSKRHRVHPEGSAQHKLMKQDGVLDTETSMQSFFVPHKNLIMPNVTDPLTVLNLAKMTFNSYYEPDAPEWKEIPGYNQTDKFGWIEKGIRGHVYTDDTREVVILTIKGTSPLTPVSGGPTAEQDKLNDNMMFSCCCAGSFMYPVCDCWAKGNICHNSCLRQRSSFQDSYYNLAQTIYAAVRSWYPQGSSFWLTGHSLGGALAALTALTNDLPAFAYEAPGELLYASRIGLLPELPPNGSQRPDYTEFLKTLPIYHIGNDKDPIYLGSCVGLGSTCWLGGYAMESKCHAGYECIYDASKKANLAETGADSDSSTMGTDVRYHLIADVIKLFLEPLLPVPPCQVKENCQECTDWTYVE